MTTSPCSKHQVQVTSPAGTAPGRGRAEPYTLNETWQLDVRRQAMTSEPVSAESSAVLMGDLVLETPNPLDLSIEDLTELAVQLEGVVASSGPSGVRVTVKGNEPLGAGNQLIDYLYVILPSIEFMKETAFVTVIASITTFMRRRFKRRHGGGRPRHIEIFGPDGRLVARVILEQEDAEPKWIEASEK